MSRIPTGSFDPEPAREKIVIGDYLFLAALVVMVSLGALHTLGPAGGLGVL